MWDYEFIGNCGIPGIGPETAKKLFQEGRYLNMADPYIYACSVIAEMDCKKSTPEHFANLKSVGHTGGMPSKETQKFIRKLGWELVDGKKFDYLIVPGYEHESTKTKVAKDKGIEMFTEEDFVEDRATAFTFLPRD